MNDGTDRAPTSNDEQVGGDHYKHPGEEEHWDRAWRLEYDCFQYIITKWVERWKVKGGLQDLEKVQHAIAKYIEVVKNKPHELHTQVHAESAMPSHRFKHPDDWNKEEKAQVAASVLDNNPLIEEVKERLEQTSKSLNESLYGDCTCGSLNPNDPNWVHTTECPARDPLLQPTPKELAGHIGDIRKRLSAMEDHWQGTKRERVIDENSNVRSNDYFTYEGGKANNDYWRCKACLEHFSTGVWQTPGRVHNACPAEPGAGYVGQD